MKNTSLLLKNLMKNTSDQCKKTLVSSSAFQKPFPAQVAVKHSEMIALEPRIVFDGAAVATVIEASDIVADDTADIVNIAEQAGAITDSNDSVTQVAFIDMSLPDAQQIAQGLNSGVTVVWIDPSSDGVEQIAGALEAIGEVDALHIFTHGDDGTFSLGNQLITNDTFSTVAEDLSSWSEYLSSDADILFYGCDLAESLNGQSLIDSIANITGADIAASTDLTGAEALGGDWDLEYKTGIIEANVVATQMLQASYAHVLAGEPQATITASAVDPLIGEQITFTVSFDNINATDPGFAPYVNLIMPALGADGTNSGDADGISFVSASYLGESVDSNVITLTDLDAMTAGIQFEHPDAVDTMGDPLVVTIDAALGVQEGDQLVVLTLPFGSVTAGLPILDVEITANVSADADVGTGLDVIANAGFKFGSDGLDNPATDPSIQAATLDAGTTNSVTITPQLYRLTTTLNAPEGETATGQNYERSYNIEIEVAAGQTIDTASLDFTFSEEMIYTSAVASGGGVIDITNLGQTASGDLSDDVLTVDYAALSGTQTITANFYIGEFDQAGANVLNPLTGAARVIGEMNNVVLAGSWDPVDARDAITPISDTQSAAQITAKSIAIQKSVAVVTDTNTAGATPGDTLEYTLDIQVSDYFAFDTITVFDIIDDGQLLVGTGTLDVVRQGVVDPQGTFTLGINFVDTTLGNDDHQIGFDVSDVIMGTDILEGGYFDSDVLGATTARLTFQTVIQDEYDSAVGNLNVKQGDTLGGTATVDAEILDTGLSQVGNQIDDTSNADITVPVENVSLSLYAINGAIGGGTDIKPGDDVTFRLEYDLVTGDFEDFDISAYLPLPAFDVDDLNADGAGGDAFLVDGVNAVPTVGLFRFGPTATADVIAGGVPVITPDIVGNALGFNFGDLSDATNDGGKIDLIFTLRVTNEPFADSLLLTTLSQQSDENSPAAVSVSDDLDQLTLQQPSIEQIIKAVVGTNVNGGDTFNPSYSSVDDPTLFFRDAGDTNANPLSGTIDSDTLAITDFDSDLTDGVDDGDLVRFAIIVENMGSSPNGAFDVTIEDTVPAGFVIPGGGINLRVVDGTGTTVAVETPSPDTALFAGGITLQDGATGAIGQFNATSGQNIVIITYDLEVADGSEAVTTITNTASLTNYANTEGGPDFTAENLTDTADVTLADARVNKNITDTDQTTTTGANLIVGEVVEYTLVIRVPEGTTSSAILTDTLDAGLAFVGITSITIDSADLTTDVVGGAAGVLAGTVFSNVGGGVDNDARQAVIDFGDLTNVNTDNTTDETITIVYEAVVVNTAAASNGDMLNNTAVWTSANDATGVTNIETITVVEPTVTFTITPSATQFDVGDTITWTVVVTAPIGNPVDTFDVVFDNLVPAGLTYVGASLANTAGVAPTTLTENAGDFQASYTTLTAGQTSTFTFDTTVDTGATFGEVFSDSGVVTWSVLSAPLGDPSTLTTVDTTRTGAGGVNDYTAAGDGSVSVILASPALTLDTTSEPSNGNSVTIGEIIRYRYKIDLPESTALDLRIEALLPNGLQFLDDGTATVAFIADGAGISSSTIAGAGLVGDETTVDGLEPVRVLGTGVDISTGPFGSGSDPQFLLGDIVNNDNDANKEFIVVEFNALVLNSADNNDADTITVDSRVLTGAVTEIFAADDVVDVVVTVQEPVIDSLTKTVINTDGTTATYRLFFSNTSGFSAFDLNVSDILPANLTNLSNVTVASSSGVTGLVDNSDATQIDIDIGTLANTGFLELTYTADIVDDSIPVPDTDFDVTWTSLPGGASTLGSSTSGVAGSTFGERTGSGVGQNDYTASAGAGLGIIEGTLWQDFDLDTLIGAENLLSGVQINLTLAGLNGVIGGGDDITLTTLTDLNGEYSFGVLPSGPYEVSVQPAGMLNGLGSQFSHTYDPTGSVTDNLISGTLTEGQVITGLNFGVGIGEISGTLFEDVDLSTTINAGDVRLSNVQINLLYAGVDGVFGNGDDQTFSDITDASGDYLFTGLQPGNYRASVETVGVNALDPNFVASFDTSGSVTDSLIDVVLGAGVRVVGQNFGVGIGEISGRLFEDVDLSDSITGGDVFLQNVQINLLYAGADGTFGSGDDQTFSDITDVNGEYDFTNLQPGNYRVSVQLVGANALDLIYTPRYDPSGAPGDNLIDVVLGPGVKSINQDFGEQDLPTPPDGADRSFLLTNDETLNFSEAQFGFTDQDRSTFDNVRIDTLPDDGSLTLAGALIVPGQVIIAADIPNILFTPNAGQVGTVNYTFSVQDSSGLFDLAPNTFTITLVERPVVAPPVDAPTLPSNPPLTPPNEPPEPISDIEGFALPSFEYFINDPKISTIVQPDFWLAGSVDQKLVIETKAFVFNVSKGIFKHSRFGEKLTYEAKMADDSPLPSWIEFDDETLTYEGKPPLGSPNVLETVIIARDTKGNEVKAPVRIIINRDLEEEDYDDVLQQQEVEFPTSTDAPTSEEDGVSDETVEEEEQSKFGDEYLNFSEQLQEQTKLSKIQKDIAFLQVISVTNPL